MAFYHVVAADIDGTLTSAGELSPAALQALDRARAGRVSVVLVTGRIAGELIADFPGITEHADAMVLENGAVLLLDDESVLLAPAVDSALDDELVSRRVPFRRGEALVATEAKYAADVVDAIGHLGLDCQIIRNRGELMVLPAGVTKGSGLRTALSRMNRSPHNTIAIGDAENDLSMMMAAELGVAVANAVDSVASRADVVLDGRDGSGVARLLDGPIVSGAQRWCPERHWIDIGTFADGDATKLPGSQGRIVVTGPPGSGKSHLIGLMAERWILSGYGVLVVDPEGDHSELKDLDNVIVVDSRNDLPEPAQLTDMLHPRTSVVVDLSGLGPEAKSGYVHRMRSVMEAHREEYGFPHWVVYDEAHLLGRGEEPRWLRRGGYVLSSFAPASLPAEELDASDIVVETTAVDRDAAVPQTTLRASIRYGDSEPRPFAVARRSTVHIRHRHKYSDVALPKERRFYFRPAEGQVLPPASTMREFGIAVNQLAPESLEFHLERGDFSRWLKRTLIDTEFAAEVASWEDQLAARRAADIERIRAHIVAAVQQRYLGGPL